jgi:hypothetical protein
LYLGSWIQQQQQNRRGGGGEIFYLTSFSSHKFRRIENYFIFKQVEKKFEPLDKELKCFLPKKIVSKLSKICVGDQGDQVNQVSKHAHCANFVFGFTTRMHKRLKTLDAQKKLK